MTVLWDRGAEDRVVEVLGLRHCGEASGLPPFGQNVPRTPNTTTHLWEQVWATPIAIREVAESRKEGPSGKSLRDTTSSTRRMICILPEPLS
jgi:hypothetical protein